jgi:hypothetical protein
MFNLRPSLADHSHRYFPGGGIAMARVLYDGLVEYDDGDLHTGGPMHQLTYDYQVHPLRHRRWPRT